MPAKREELLSLAQQPEDRLLISQLWDKMSQAEKYFQPACTPFLDLRQQNLYRTAMERMGNRGFFLYGGYPQAERRLALFLPDYMETPDDIPLEDNPICALRARPRGGVELNHRDYLGSLMGLGIRREMVGDILVSPQSADILLTAEMGEYVRHNLEKAGHASIVMEPVALENLLIPPLQFKTLRDTVPSLRLDAVLTVAFSLSRGEAAECIRRGLVQVDGADALKGDKPVPEGARISLRGKGKAILAQIGGLSKKGRIQIEVHKLI